VEQRVSLVTLGTADLARAKAFYEALGWRGQEVQETVFFQAGGLAIVLWSRAELAADAGLGEVDGVDGFGGVALAQNVRTREEVDAVLAAVDEAGGSVTLSARETFYGGYAGYFTDPDGHVWEVAYNPGFTLNPDGTLTLPDFGAT
jgi:catechol 2,3-dioxygenase-like lactoylglutathione lyase family enzyme